ncbi:MULTISPECIES: nucleotidyltransferase family protein [Deferrisoma]
MIDLPAPDLEEVRRLVARHLPGREVRVFGSRVEGTARRFSDLDLAVVGPASDEELEALRDAFSASDLPIQVDLVRWEDLPDGIRGAIGGRFVVLQEAGAR